MMAEDTIRKYSALAISQLDQLLYGICPHPLECGLGLTIGGGQVFPEVNFTLPPMNMTDETWPEVLAHYKQMAEQILRRAASLATPGLVLEFELLPPMTVRPEWGAELTALLKSHMQGYYHKYQLPCALRVTPTDMRDQQKPP
jgi:methanol---5-hydroxybenzimidazolylcobamide Co-methyltransferase